MFLSKLNVAGNVMLHNNKGWQKKMEIQVPPVLRSIIHSFNAETAQSIKLAGPVVRLNAGVSDLIRRYIIYTQLGFICISTTRDCW